MARRDVRCLARAAALALTLCAAGDAFASRTYIAPGSELHFASARVPLAAELIGRGAAAALAPGGAPAAPIWGSLPDGAPPPGWQRAEPAALAAMRQGPAPLAASASGVCACATELERADDERIAALYAVRRFEIGDELDRVRLLRLRVLYRDGIAVYLNGREVARRELSPGEDAAFALRDRGPEWETFVVPAVPGLLRRGANALAVEVRPSASDVGPLLDLALEADTALRLSRGPMLQRVGARSATLVFDTELPARARVEFGATAALGRVAVSAGGELARHHVADLSDLAGSGPVHYRVVAGDDVTDTFAFHLAPGPELPLRLGVYGDVRGGHDMHEQIAASLAREAPDAILVTGDLVAHGTDEADWQRLFAAAAVLLPSVPFYPAIGNHDLGRAGDEQRRMNEIFALWPGPPDRPEWGHWYGFTVAGVHIVMLDSNSYASPEQQVWLARELASARAAGVRAILAVAHDGPYSRGPHGGDPVAASVYAPLLGQYGVSLMLAGHDHLYERGEVQGLPYVVTGGGGAPLYPPRCGVSGTPRCAADGAKRVESAHHYLMVTVYAEHVELCAKRPDGTPLESCVRYPLR